MRKSFFYARLRCVRSSHSVGQVEANEYIMIDFRIFLSAVLFALPSDCQDPNPPNMEKLVAGAVGTSHAPVERDDRLSTALSKVF